MQRTLGTVNSERGIARLVHDDERLTLVAHFADGSTEPVEDLTTATIIACLSIAPMLKIRVLKVLCIIMHPSLLFCCRSGQRDPALTGLALNQLCTTKTSLNLP